jgi:hypothetical protein
MLKNFTYVSLIFLSLIFLGCSNSDTNQNQPEKNKEQFFFSKVSYDNIIGGELRATVEFEFDKNKVVVKNGFNASGEQTSTRTYAYNDKGLLIKSTGFNQNGEIDIINTFNYENGNVTSVERIRNIFMDTIYNVISYSNNLIENELINTKGDRLIFTQHYLNEDGFIYKSDNGITAEINLIEGLPISKKIVYPDNVVEFEHIYLENPIPIGPWKNFWSNLYGNLNNQIIRQTGGVLSHEDAVDLPKYIISAGSQVQREYEFNAEGLPIKIEKTFNNDFKSIWTIEYQN